jgi:uncharacterized membrane protein YoaK (UPF0700 family)
VLYGNESISTYTRSNVLIWMTLAFQAGILNIGGLLACHSFVSHVTGFATLFGVQVNRGNWTAAEGMLLVPLFFLLGAMLSGFLIDIRLKLHKKPKYYMVFGFLFLLLFLIVVGGFNGFFGAFGEPLESTEDYTLLAVISLVCGMQNGMVTLVSKSVVRTTHLTGVTTDLGIGLVRVLYSGALGEKIGEEGRANFMRIGIITFFTCGGAVGYSLFSRYAYRGFLFPMAISGLLFFGSIYFQVLRPKKA